MSSDSSTTWRSRGLRSRFEVSSGDGKQTLTTPRRPAAWELPGGSRDSAWRRQTSGAIRARRTTSFGSRAQRCAGEGSHRETAWRCSKSSTEFCPKSAQEKNAQKSKKRKEQNKLRVSGSFRFFYFCEFFSCVIFGQNSFLHF